MKQLLLLLVPILLSGQDTFQPLTGETSAGEIVTIPATGHTGLTVVGMAFGKQAGPLLEDWYAPAYLRFVAKHGLFAGTYDAQVFFVPMFVGANKAAYDPSIRKFRKSANPEIVDHVVFFKGDADPYLQELGMKDKGIPYFFIIDGEGRVLHRTEGAFSDAKLDAMEAVLME